MLFSQALAIWIGGVAARSILYTIKPVTLSDPNCNQCISRDLDSDELGLACLDTCKSIGFDAYRHEILDGNDHWMRLDMLLRMFYVDKANVRVGDYEFVPESLTTAGPALVTHMVNVLAKVDNPEAQGQDPLHPKLVPYFITKSSLTMLGKNHPLTLADQTWVTILAGAEVDSLYINRFTSYKN